MAEEDIRQFSLANLAQRRKEARTLTRHDAPERPVDPAFWDAAQVVMPPAGKASVHLRIDADVLDWFRAQGKGHLTRMNAVLKSYVQAQKR